MRKNRLLGAALTTIILLAGVFVLPGPAYAAMNVQRFEQSSAYNGDDFKWVSAFCPTGTRVIGGGGDLSGGGQNVHLVGLHPDVAANAYKVLATEHSPTNASWKVTAHVICAPEPAGWHVVDLEVGGGSATSYADEVFCDAGEKVLGVGARVAAPDTGKVFLTYVKPTITGNGTD